MSHNLANFSRFAGEIPFECRSPVTARAGFNTESISVAAAGVLTCEDPVSFRNSTRAPLRVSFPLPRVAALAVRAGGEAETHGGSGDRPKGMHKPRRCRYFVGVRVVPLGGKPNAARPKAIVADRCHLEKSGVGACISFL